MGGKCTQYIYRAHVFLMRILSACLSQLVITVVLVQQPLSHALTPRTAWLKNHGAHCLSHLTTPSTCTLSLSSTLSSLHVLHPPLPEHKPCGPHLSGDLAEPSSFTHRLCTTEVCSRLWRSCSSKHNAFTWRG